MVDKVAPAGSFCVYPTTQKDIATAGVTGRAGGRVLGADLRMEGELRQERVVEKGCDKCGIVRGVVKTLDRNRRESNAASRTPGGDGCTRKLTGLHHAA